MVPRSSSEPELLRDLLDELREVRSDLAVQHAEIQLVRAELDELLTLTKRLASNMPVHGNDSAIG